MYDIITFGSAAQDIHLKSKAFKIIENDKVFETGEGICLPFGSKIEVQDIIFSSGGGGTNTAATFAKQGFRTAFCGAIGADVSGLEIVRELKHLHIDTRFVVKKKEFHTNQSIIISNIGSEPLKDSADLPQGAEQNRTIMIYRGASDMLDKNDIQWKKINKAKWFYLAPLTNLLCDSFEYIVNFAYENKIKIAINPSEQQLSLPEDKLRRIFSKIDILFLNQEEASFLAKASFKEEREVFQKIDKMFPGVVVMTKGAQGVVVSDGKFLYSALPNPYRQVVDTTGAGDSFASGFLSDYIRYNGDIEKAIQFGLANSGSNIEEIGAKNGLLEKNSKFNRSKVSKENIKN